jgi:hypothetical protein
MTGLCTKRDAGTSRRTEKTASMHSNETSLAKNLFRLHLLLHIEFRRVTMESDANFVENMGTDTPSFDGVLAATWNGFHTGVCEYDG